MRSLSACVIGFVFLLGLAPLTLAQMATIRGFVTDAATTEPMEGVNLLVDDELGGIHGAVSDLDGIYAISRIPPGVYVFRASFIGYSPYVDTLAIRAGQTYTINIDLEFGNEALGELFVEADRYSGAARVTAGLQSVSPEDIELVPAPDVSADLATYLTTLPGVVSVGDRGGQLFIRGGEPSHNMVLLDGMYVHQPFHILGFYSAFPADIINRADVYAGGYGSKYGGRISSVIDVRTRNGSKNGFAGSASIAPFVSGVRLEGPLIKNRLSLIGSLRESVIDQGAGNYIKDDLPYSFGDIFLKGHAILAENQQLSVSYLNTHDDGRLGEPSIDQVLDEIRWTNKALGVRYLFLSKGKPFVGELLFSVSRMRSELGPELAPTRSSQFNNFNYQVNFTNFIGRTEWHYGVFTRAPAMQSELGGLFQNEDIRIGRRHKIGLYLEPDIHISTNLQLRIGAAFQMFTATDEFQGIYEPRARLVWNKGIHEVSMAAGRYHQEVLGLTDRRDAANIFTAWVNAPTEDRTDATHFLMGYRITPTPWLEIAAEGFYKDLKSIFIAEWTAFPRFTTRVQPADGEAYGFDFRAEVRRPNFYGYLNYGLSNVEYFARQASLPLWFGTEALRFNPPHDRRHQMNVLVSSKFSEYDVSVRWNFGTGLPFNQVIGFDGFVNSNGIQDPFTVEDDRRIIYERPFRGTLPTYHRLDVSVERTFEFDRVNLIGQLGIINAYNRRNLLSLDTFTLRRSDQLPFVPTLGLRVEFQ